MVKLLMVFLAAAALAPASAAAQPASMYSGAVLTAGTNCLIPDTRRELRVFACTSGADRYLLGSDGTVRTRDGLCWDHGVPAGADLTRNNAVLLAKCHGGKSQVWYFTGDARALVQSAANSAACVTIERDQAGARAVVAQCTYKDPPRTQQFFRYWRITPEQRLILQVSIPGALQWMSREGAVTFDNGTRMVAAGGGNMVAAGGGNMVAAGGGNMVAAGGGNMVAAGGGNILPSGAGGFTDAQFRALIHNATPVRGR